MAEDIVPYPWLRRWLMSKNIVLRFIINYLLAIDQLFNTLLLGHPDETISSRLGRSKNKERYFWVRPFRIFVNALFYFDRGPNGEFHCEASILPLEQKTFRTLDYEIWSWNKKG